MIYIKNKLTKILENSLYKINLIDKNLIKINIIKNKKFGNFTIYGFINFKKKNTNNIKIINWLLINILKKIKKVKYIEKFNFLKKNFINIFIKKEYIEYKLNKMFLSNNFNIKKNKKEKIVLDYSSPNMSKEMHIGHLRSMILGDTFFRVSKYLGNIVIKINHIGDWGINYGMIIAKIKENNNINKLIKNNYVKNLEKLYINSKIDYKKSKKFKNKSKFYLYKLIKNDKKIKLIWNKIIFNTLKNNEKIYRILDIKLNRNDILGESFYQKYLLYIIKDLLNRKIAIKKKNKIIVMLNNIKNKKGNNMGVILKNKNNYLYSLIEIASIRYRCKYLFADRLVYYTDNRQKDHLKLSYIISKISNYIDNKTKFEHHMFGIIFNKNKLPFKTKDGNNIKLKYLINKTIIELKKFIYKNNKLKIKYKKEIILNLSIGSLKYFDLSKNRLTDYIIDWNKIFSFKNNTLIYIQYSYIRIYSILNKYNIKNKNIKNFKIILENEIEKNIAYEIINFELIIKKVYKLGTPNLLCDYIYNLSKLFNNFYIKDNILNIKIENIKNSRLNLIILISKIIKKSLYLLGIKTINYI